MAGGDALVRAGVGLTMATGPAWPPPRRIESTTGDRGGGPFPAHRHRKGATEVGRWPKHWT